MKSVAIVSRKMITGGVEKALIAMLKKFDYSKVSVDLYLEAVGGDLFSELPKEVNVYSIPTVSKQNFFTHPLLFLKKIFHIVLLRTKKHSYLQECFFASQSLCPIKKKYDYAISYHAPNTIPVFYVIDKIKADKKILWLHGDLETNSGDNKLLLKYHENYDKVFAVSKSVYDSFIKYHPLKKNDIELFYNFVDVENIKKQSELGPSFENDNSFKILTIGRLDKQKGYDLAVKACKILVDKGYHFHWYVCGEGLERTAIEELISINNLKDTFILLGNQSNPYGYLANCNLYVQPSITEGYCTTTNEARMLYKPVITTEVSGSKEQFEDNFTGWIVPIDYNSIASKIEDCLNNTENLKRISSNLKKTLYINSEQSINKIFS